MLAVARRKAKRAGLGGRITWWEMGVAELRVPLAAVTWLLTQTRRGN
jgi:hypothetical protein